MIPSVFPTGGHYVACCKNFVTGKWYEFNDSYVSEGNAAADSTVF